MSQPVVAYVGSLQTKSFQRRQGLQIGESLVVESVVKVQIDAAQDEPLRWQLRDVGNVLDLPSQEHNT